MVLFPSRFRFFIFPINTNFGRQWRANHRAILFSDELVFYCREGGEERGEEGGGERERNG